MTRKIMLSLVVGMAVVALGGWASADAPVMGLESSDTTIHQWAADPELAVGQGESYQEREPLETGSMPAGHGTSSELICCAGDSGPTQGEAGENVPRPGIDDGP